MKTHTHRVTGIGSTSGVWIEVLSLPSLPKTDLGKGRNYFRLKTVVLSFPHNHYVLFVSRDGVIERQSGTVESFVLRTGETQGHFIGS